MAHYGMGIYNDNTIMSSIYANQEVRYANYMPTPQTYNTNVVDRSHIVIHVLSIYVNIYNLYSSSDSLDGVITMLIFLSILATYIMDLCLVIHQNVLTPFSQTPWIYGVTNEPTSQAFVGTLKTGYPRIQALSQGKELGVYPRASTQAIAPGLASLLR
jgi:hypothetical protein